MKISKLFHWLYALVMFLPILFFIPNVFYYAFNEHAVNESSTQVDIRYKYQSNEVNTLDDLNNGYIYNIEELTIGDGDGLIQYFGDFGLYIYSFSTIRMDDYEFSNVEEVYFSDYSSAVGNYLYFYYSPSDPFISLTFTNSECYTQLNYSNTTEFVFENLVFSIDNVEGFIEYVSSPYYISVYGDVLPQYTDFNVLDDVEVITDVEETITQKVYYGWQSVWSLPVFSWTSNTFFSAPFNYISGLFGFQSGNTLSNCLSYWFSISIIWLTFDLMMYVPLLVHKWLDKASIS